MMADPKPILDELISKRTPYPCSEADNPLADDARHSLHSLSSRYHVLRQLMAIFYILDSRTLTGCVTHQWILRSRSLIRRFILMQTTHLESCHLFFSRLTLTNKQSQAINSYNPQSPHPYPYFHSSKVRAGSMHLLGPCRYRTASLGCQPTMESKRPRSMTGLPFDCRRVSSQ